MNGYRLDRVSVLVVDDNKNMRSLMRAVLEALGCKNIYEANDGEHGLSKLREANVDLVITDWNMEPMDGLELTRRVRTDPDTKDPYLPVIMLSGHTERHRVMEARDAGVTEFVAKPVAARSLYTRIVTIIEHPRPFVKTTSYFGPDRRRQDLPFPGPERRQALIEAARAKGGEQAQAQLKEARETIGAINKT